MTVTLRDGEHLVMAVILVPCGQRQGDMGPETNG